MSISFDERYERLLISMEALAALLSRYGEQYWADWVRRDLEMIRLYERYGLERMLSAFGGMGSLTDLRIHPYNGHPISSDEIELVNDQLAALSDAVSRDVSAILEKLR